MTLKRVYYKKILENIQPLFECLTLYEQLKEYVYVNFRRLCHSSNVGNIFSPIRWNFSLF